MLILFRGINILQHSFVCLSVVITILVNSVLMQNRISSETYIC